jgi:hypothetical protein|tara:strand:+ start:234 stop:704 length:471 start_codon:yes stop_codon:yes gene_type:complete
MKDYQLTKVNMSEFINSIYAQLDENPVLIVTAQTGNVGKWGMAKLFRAWMTTTAEFMAARGVTMPLMVKSGGGTFGTREFNATDAHELFTNQWLGVDENGLRLSWSKVGRDGMRPATKAERYYALNRHEVWAMEKGLMLFKPRDSEYEIMQREEVK